MLNIKEIEKYYPEHQRPFKKNILREYLQFKILQIIFNTKASSKISFMGGSCLRMVHGTARFSEDLDFDNFNLSEKEFERISLVVKNGLEADGYSIEIKNVFHGAFRCYIRIPKLLFDNELSGYEKEKILIQLDTEAQGFEYKREKFLLNKFDVFTEIFVTPSDILLSQKLWAILNRKVLKGRDFYDVVYLFGLTKPNFVYLYRKAGVSNIGELKEKMLSRIHKTNLESLTKDVEPFLMHRTDTLRITKFRDFIQSLK